MAWHYCAITGVRRTLKQGNLVYYKSVTAGFSYPTEIMLSTKRTLVTNQVSNADKLGDFGAVEKLGTAIFLTALTKLVTVHRQ